MRYWSIVVPIDTKSVFLIEKIAAENKHVREGTENMQIIPSLIDVMTAGFTLIFLSRNGSTAVSISHSKLDLKACVQNKGVFKRLFGIILISHMSEVSYHQTLF